MARAGIDPDRLVLGPSAHMQSVYAAIPAISAGDSPVWLLGEPGTGKELFARVIHDSSARRGAPFVPVCCAGLSAAALEAELFGHERGAFAGAARPRAGRFEQAHEGTVFLDDLDEAPPAVQARLARVLQEGHCERLGGSRPVTCRVRVIAASTRDLRALSAEGRFREGLLHQVSAITLTLPPLRERREDIPVLMRHFLARAARRRGQDAPVLSAHAEHAYTRYHWPGNVREVESVCDRLVQTCACGTVRTGCLGSEVLFDPRTAPAAPTPAFEPPLSVSLDDRLHQVEAQLIAWALRVAGGNKSRAAGLLRIKRTTLADRIGRHDSGRFEYPQRRAGGDGPEGRRPREDRPEQDEPIGRVRDA